MKRIHAFRTAATLLLSLALATVQAQEDELGTETVTVVRSYSPTVSDAYKIKSLPNLNDSIVTRKKEVRYSIFSVPVASTFTPAKGRAADVERTAPEKLFNSYAAIGLGNYNNALADFYLSRDFDRGGKRFDVGLNHFSSRGALDGTVVDTDFYDTDLDLTFTRRDRDWNWNVSAGAEHRKYHWYGLPEGTVDPVTAEGLDAAQNYLAGQVSGELKMEDGYFRKANFLARHFRDGLASAENRLRLSGALQFPVTEESLDLGVELDYLGGRFDNADQSQYTNTGGIDYQYLIGGIRPGLLLLRDNLKLYLGTRLVAGLDMENSENNFYVYPDVRASYRLLEEAVVAFGGVEGSLVQQSYYDYSQNNPFVSPTLQVRPTDRQYEAYLGIKGQLASQLSYTLKGSYTAENYRPLFILNPQNPGRGDEKAYNYGNSFRVFYDDMKTLGVFGELQLTVKRNFTLGVNAAFYDYDTETDNPAWNLPSVEAGLSLDYRDAKGWYLGANLFYLGEREDFASVAQPNTAPEDYPASIITLDGFFDANAHAGYHINPQLSLFVKASNLADNAYQRWANFPVQGLQVLAGVSYKFDL
ncbi:TonB-dependent receptor [Robiginitalea sp. M366]|uniref:TonB-dependent receptor domain-containing protein n=1 Tax=Robiginitalea aestuariiviva TaxID=3036903 RepID=UPI00240E2EAA|nr:TonB-dependent receptor [Robiginitalea aestuariiviva]MDG1572202.1 TonB-dependent receptor [Robiginitalea aestuariiviva]